MHNVPLASDLHIAACIASVTEFIQEHFGTGGDNETSKRPDTILLKHDVGYNHLAENLHHELEAAVSGLGFKILYQRIPTKTAQSAFSQNLLSNPQQPDPSTEDSTSTPTSINPALLYIGGESLTLTNILMTHGLSDVFSYDPSTHVTGLASSRSNRLLMKRYAAVQHARDADVFGILVGTLGV
ncbi:hypothetical protein H0H93_004250, partial [Arthromyces matolae]